MADSRFRNIEEFIEFAHAGDIYQEETNDGFGHLTFKAKSRRLGRDHLRAERLATRIIPKDSGAYVYRTTVNTGTLFSTRDRHGDPAFLATTAKTRVIALVEVAKSQHSQIDFLLHHGKIATTLFAPKPIQKVSA